MFQRKPSSADLTIFKIFISIVLISTFVGMLLFIITFVAMLLLGGDHGKSYPSIPGKVLAQISENFSIASDDRGGTTYSLADETVLPKEDWCILLNDKGDIVWSLHRPADVPAHYSLNDIARLTRWFLADYPVYVRTEDYGLFILGLPKDSLGKYPLEYTMEWFDSLPQRILIVFLLNAAIACILSSIAGSFLYQKIRLLMRGLAALRKEEAVALPAKGIFKEPFSNINQISQTLARKNHLLASRDSARSNWISGISHDIRTPLSMVVGFGGQLAESAELSEENRKNAAVITAQGLKIKKLIEDLNLISSLEYDMQPHNRKPLKICVLLRSVVSDIMNCVTQEKTDAPYDIPQPHALKSGTRQSDKNSGEAYEISIDLNCEQAVVSGDESLLARAFYNLLQNSIAHNESGCHIILSGSLQTDKVLIEIADDGQGVPEKVLENLDSLPNTAHGFGLPMACKIIRAHGGTFHAENREGFVVTVGLPTTILNFLDVCRKTGIK